MSTAVMIATTAAIIAASSASNHSGSSQSCPVSEFGSVCLATFLVLIILAAISLVAGMTRDWGDRWMGAAAFLACASVIPVIVGMIHDC